MPYTIDESRLVFPRPKRAEKTPMAFLSNTRKTVMGVGDFQNPYFVLIWNLIECSAIHLVYITLQTQTDFFAKPKELR
ncbi:hypothetical protein HBI56_072400 [Parastagonospora nodorum]|nr:hypothetical protein HBH53_146680 [Parastagonospora nodorum]KAH4128839.1 hypothetical protein HBH47_029140 [Parastagonospora nodorum]KAH4210978.1 hypothetical protein HBI95_067030 [Parastagonospora nodorum]KAH4267310.1 hypothetical protein HBI03_070610 [Parastagonospora nodorum]KAH4278301.1 hypothetical protein HBI04_092320 [Parastagonospora nodorum]